MFGWRKRKSGLIVPSQKIYFGGRFKGEIFRKGDKIDEFEFDNLVVNQGLNDNLNCYLNGGTQTTLWYMGIFQGNYTPLASDTAATFPGNSTECSSYTSATRPRWQNPGGSVSGQSITNSAAAASYTFNGGVTVYGAFLTSSSVIAGTSGILFSAAQFGAPKTVAAADQLLLTYTFGATSS